MIMIILGGCATLTKQNFFAKLANKDDKVIRIIGSTPEDPVNVMHVTLLSAIASAEKTVYLTMAYFVPDPQTIEIFQAAARRGVEVKLILPGFSDFGAVFHAGR